MSLGTLKGTIYIECIIIIVVVVVFVVGLFIYVFIYLLKVATNVKQLETKTIFVPIQTCEQRQVSHFQYLSWPDYGVPTSAVTLIDFLGAVKRQQRKTVKALGPQWTGHPLGPPMVVHCSAGIGRTGEVPRLYFSTNLTYDYWHYVFIYILFEDCKTAICASL